MTAAELAREIAEDILDTPGLFEPDPSREDKIRTIMSFIVPDIEPLVKDRERLDVIEARASGNGICLNCVGVEDDRRWWFVGQDEDYLTLREAIDAAIAAEGKGES